MHVGGVIDESRREDLSSVWDIEDLGQLRILLLEELLQVLILVGAPCAGQGLDEVKEVVCEL